MQEIETLLARHEAGLPTLARMKACLERFHLEFGRVIVVGGTNGKGSTSATLAHLLKAAGERVGLFTSPHLISLTERFSLNGVPLTEAQVSESCQFVVSRIEGLEVTRFEILTLMALDLFVSGRVLAPVERLILEVGVGGLYDPTNAVPHDFSIVTKLGLDHQKILGSTLPEIARNKFGIVTPGGTVVHADLPPEVVPVAREIERQTKSRWVESRSGKLHVKSGPEFWLESPWGEARLALAGPRGAENTLLALTAFEELGYSPEDYLSCLDQLCWPGRMEKVAENVYLSGDHNEPGLQSLVELLPSYPYRSLYFLVGIGSEKDAESMLQVLSQVPRSHLCVTETPFKSRPLTDYGRWRERAVVCEASPTKALAQVRARAQADDLIVVTGSLYLVGLMRKHLLC